jgi:hypothetical protein
MQINMGAGIPVSQYIQHLQRRCWELQAIQTRFKLASFLLGLLAGLLAGGGGVLLWKAH